MARKQKILICRIIARNDHNMRRKNYKVSNTTVKDYNIPFEN